VATKHQLEDLKQHPAWLEIKQLLLDRLLIIRDELEVGKDVNGPLSIEEQSIRRGECKNIRFTTELPDAIIRDIGEGKEEESWREKEQE